MTRRRCRPDDLVTRTSPFGCYATCGNCHETASIGFHSDHKAAWYAGLREHVTTQLTGGRR